MVPMGDGVRLATDVYLPADHQSGERLPAVLIRTCYRKDTAKQFFAFAHYGYAVIAQDTRGREDSEGEWQPIVNERQDGADTLNWIAEQPWSDGKVGMIGASYLAIVQWEAAASNNPHLRAMISMVTGFAVNIGVNYYLMFPMGMGIRGAAWGTVTAQLVVLVISVAVLLKAYKEKARPALEGKLAAGICRSGVTAFGVSLAPTVALIFTNWQCLRYGGNAAVACYAVISYIVFPVQYLLTGIGDGVQPLLSYYNGAGKPAELAQVRKTARAGAGVLGVITMAAVFICTPHLARWFGLSDEAAVFFETGMRISALAFLVTGFVKFNLSYLNAVLKTKLAVILTFAESLIVSPAYLFLLPVAVGMSGIWISLPATAVTMLVIYGIINRKEMSYEKKD